MRSKKMLGLVVATALAALAFSAAVGVGSASATIELCKEDQLECNVNKQFPNPVTLEARSADFTITTYKEIAPIKCSATMTMETESKHSGVEAELEGQVTSFKLSSCTYSYCAAGPMQHLPYKTSIDGNSRFRTESSGNGNPAIELRECDNLLKGIVNNCIYRWEATNVISEGTQPGIEIKASTWKKESGPSGCISSIEVSAHFVLTGSSLHYSASSSSSAIEAGVFNVTCGSAGMEGSALHSSAGSMSAFWLTSCSGSCPTANTLGTPYTTSFAIGTEGGGTLTVSEGPKVELTGCFGFTKCTYTASSPSLEYSSGSLVASKESLVRTTGAYCPSTAQWSGTYTLSPEGLYLTQL